MEDKDFAYKEAIEDIRNIAKKSGKDTVLLLLRQADTGAISFNMFGGSIDIMTLLVTFLLENEEEGALELFDDVVRYAHEIKKENEENEKNKKNKDKRKSLLN